MADYNQGRRFGNASGQPGAFGTSSGFGGFGTQQASSGPFGAAQTGGGLFGSQPTSTSSPFGGTQTANSGFGGSGLFGQKPATTNLFGSTPASTSQTSGGLFGTSGQSGFGGAQSTGTGFGTGGNLFGGNGQQQKPASGFSFGGASPGTGFGASGTGTGFGAGTTSNTTGGGLFGTNQTTSAFGGGQPQTAASNPFGAFGSNQQNQTQTATGSAFGAFGGQQPKPGGLFGATNSTTNNPGGGLFGTNTQANDQQQPAAGGLFGTNNQSSSTSIFGAPKPATAGTGLFGNSPSTTNNAAGGLFGGFGANNNNQTQQNAGGGLFGAANQSQQKPGGLFGNTSTATGGGLFGGSTNSNAQQPAGGSLFGGLGSNSQQQQPNSLFGNTNNSSSGLFSNTQQQQNALQPPQTMTASLGDRYPYGSASIFDGLPPPPQSNPGPLATPINTGNKMRKSAILPHYKINPNTASRLATPQKRGYGFSYSTYGTPSSVSSNVSTPGGFGSSLLYGNIGRGLGKSLSTSNLRRTFDHDRESILTPGAFSAGSSRSGSNSGSLKKLTIDRTLRTDLFGNQGVTALPSPEKNDQSRQPGILKKKVSFDASTFGGNGTNQDSEMNGVADGANNSQLSTTPSAQEQGFLRSSSRPNGRLNGSRANGAPSQPEMEQAKGNELAIVHEDEPPEAPVTSSLPTQSQVPQADSEPGSYYMIPSRAELSKMPKPQLKSVKSFCVGREGCGRVVFDEPVDLTTVDLNDVFGKIAVIQTRSLTVYPETDQKPPLGKGLNVPSTIYLENSWPRQKDRKTLSHEKSGPRFQKHVDRLRKVTGTEFVRYEKDTGTWVFKVPHFTTYEFDYDDTGSEGDSLHTSGLSEPPDTPTPNSRTPRNRHLPTPGASAQGASFLSEDPSKISSSPDDTFEFRRKKVLPGAFDDTAAFGDEQEVEEVTYQDQSFLDERLAVSPSESGDDEPSEIQSPADGVQVRSLIVHEEDLEMVGSFPHPDDGDTEVFNASGNPTPKSIMRSYPQSHIGLNTPGILKFHGCDEWAEELQRTISPRKQDRQALRESQAHVMKDRDLLDTDTPKANKTTNGTGRVLATSIDLMNSLFGHDQARRSGWRPPRAEGKGKGFEV